MTLEEIRKLEDDDGFIKPTEISISVFEKLVRPGLGYGKKDFQPDLTASGDGGIIVKLVSDAAMLEILDDGDIQLYGFHGKDHEPGLNFFFDLTGIKTGEADGTALVADDVAGASGPNIPAQKPEVAGLGGTLRSGWNAADHHSEEAGLAPWSVWLILIVGWASGTLGAYWWITNLSGGE